MAILVCLKVTFYILMATITMVLAYLVVVEGFFFFFFVILPRDFKITSFL